MTENDYADIAGKAYFLKGDMEYVFFYNDKGVYYMHWKPYDKIELSKFNTLFGEVPVYDKFNKFLESIKFGHDRTSFIGESHKSKGKLLFPDGLSVRFNKEDENYGDWVSKEFEGAV